VTIDDEVLAAGRLAGDAAAGLTEVVAGMHAAIGRRVRRFLPPGARPVGDLALGGAQAVYATVGVAERLVARGAAAGVVAHRRRQPASPRPATLDAVLPALHGIWGDTIETRHPALALTMAVRVDGRPVAAEPAALAAAFPDATPDLVVLVHGLTHTERAWGDPGYGEHLRDALHLTPVRVRYNSGRRIHANGHDLAELLAAVVAGWPVPVRSIAVVGHSMGGLVARSAAHQADEAGAAWLPLLRTIVTIGTPHLGAPLAQGVHLADRALAVAPETAPLSRLLQTRSVGVQDLQHGRVVPHDGDGDPTDPPPVAGVTTHVVSGTMTRDPRHPVGRITGDGMVLPHSAAGRSRARDVGVPPSHHLQLGGVDHVGLLRHPDVADQLVRWLDPA
jgi:hypothetical protein